MTNWLRDAIRFPRSPRWLRRAIKCIITAVGIVLLMGGTIGIRDTLIAILLAVALGKVLSDVFIEFLHGKVVASKHKGSIVMSAVALGYGIGMLYGLSIVGLLHRLQLFGTTPVFIILLLTLGIAETLAAWLDRPRA